MKKIVLASLLVLSWNMVSVAQQKTGTTSTSTSTGGATAGKTKQAEPTPEQRSQMAAMHDSMAKCLRTNKSMTECHDEMMKNCPMGESCPSMGMWGKSEKWGKKRAMHPGDKIESKTDTESKEKTSY